MAPQQFITALDEIDARDAQRLHKRWPLARLFAITLQAVFTAVLITVVVWKVLEPGGWAEVFLYLTNWVWFANLVFFASDLVAGYASVHFFTYVSFYAFWALHGLNWLVFWLVFPLFHQNAGLIRDNASLYSLGIVMDGDRVFHVLPLVVTLLWLLLRFEEMKRVTAAVERRAFHFFATLLLAGVAVPIILGTVYTVTHDATLVYNVNFPPSVVTLGSVLLLVVFNGVALYAVTNLGTTATRHQSFFAATLIWLLVGWATTIWWLSIYGAASYFARFEFWVWLYALVYFSVDLLLPRTFALSRSVLHWYAFWPLNTLVWIIFWLPFLAFGDNALMMLDIDQDGDFSGTEILLDRVLHVVPLVFLLVYVYTRMGALARSVSTQPLLNLSHHTLSYEETSRHDVDSTYLRAPTWASVAAVVTTIWLLPLAIGGVWWLAFEPRFIYGAVETPTLAWLVLCLCIATIFGFGTFLVFRLSEPRERVRDDSHAQRARRAYDADLRRVAAGELK